MQIKKSMQCTTDPLQYLIDNGETIDFRLDEQQWQDLNVGDVIEYWEDFSGWQTEPAPNSRKVIVRITDIFRARNFEQLVDVSKQHGFFDGHNADDIILDLRRWWSQDKEKRTGVLGLKVKCK